MPPRNKPTRLKILEGVRESRINRHEPQPVALEPDPPRDMAPEALEVWRFTIDELRAMKLLHRCDRDVLVAYCEAVKTHREASRVLATSPLLITGQKGNLVRNPVLAIQRDAADMLRKLAQEFGLTPAARSRINMEERQTMSGSYDADNPFSGQGRETPALLGRPVVGASDDPYGDNDAYVDDALDDALDAADAFGGSGGR